MGYKIRINVRHRSSPNQPHYQSLCDVELPLKIQALGKAVQRDVGPRALDPARSWSSVLPKHTAAHCQNYSLLASQWEQDPLGG